MIIIYSAGKIVYLKDNEIPMFGFKVFKMNADHYNDFLYTKISKIIAFPPPINDVVCNYIAILKAFSYISSQGHNKFMGGFDKRCSLQFNMLDTTDLTEVSRWADDFDQIKEFYKKRVNKFIESFRMIHINKVYDTEMCKLIDEIDERAKKYCFL